MTAAVEAIDLRRTFTTRSGVVRRTRKDVEAVKGVSFEIAPGELQGLVGTELLIGTVYLAVGRAAIRLFEHLSWTGATLDKI